MINYENGNYAIFTSYFLYSAGDVETLVQDIMAGNVVVIDGQYYMKPEVVTGLYHAEIDLRKADAAEYTDRTAFADMEINFE